MPDSLRELFATGLRRRGFRRLAEDEPGHAFEHLATGFSIGLLSSVLVGIIVTLRLALDWTLFGAAAATFLALALMAVVLQARPVFGYVTFLLVWAAIGFLRLVDDGVGALVATHVLPFLVVSAAFGMVGATRLAVRVPILLPVALLVIAFPLLSQDLWDLGSDIDDRLIWVALVAIGPISVLVVARLLRVSLQATFEQAQERIADLDNPEAAAVDLAKARAPRELREGVDDTKAQRRLSGAFGQPALAHAAARIIDTEGKRFRRRVLLRLVPLTVGLAAVIALFIYLLAIAAIPIETAERWAIEQVPQEHVSILGIDLHLPVGPYLQVPALLASIGTAAFLAFVLTEDRYSTDLYETLIRRPAYECLVLTAGVLHLRP